MRGVGYIGFGLWFGIEGFETWGQKGNLSLMWGWNCQENQLWQNLLIKCLCRFGLFCFQCVATAAKQNKTLIYLFIFLWCCHPTRARASSFLRFLDNILWTSDLLVAETSTWQYTILTANILAPGGIRTHNLNTPVAEELVLRPCCR